MSTDPEVRAIAWEQRQERERLAEQLRAAESRGGVTPEGGSLAERVRNSATLERFREVSARGGRPNLDLTLADVVKERELVSAIRARANVDSTSAAGLVVEDASARLVSVAPKPARIPSLVRVIPTDDLLVHGTETGSYVGSAGGVPDGAALPTLTNLALTDESIKLGPFGVAGEVTRGHVRDRGVFSEVVERIFRRDFMRAVETQILTGDGAETATQVNFLGITADPAVPTFARTTETRLDVVAKAQENVQIAGYDDAPLTLVAHPTTLRAIFGEAPSANVREVLYAVGSVVPSVAMPVGTAVVGDFYEGTALFVHGGVDLEATDSHASNFLAGLVTLRLTAYMAYRTVNPTAFYEVTGL